MLKLVVSLFLFFGVARATVVDTGSSQKVMPGSGAVWTLTWTGGFVPVKDITVHGAVNVVSATIVADGTLTRTLVSAIGSTIMATVLVDGGLTRSQLITNGKASATQFAELKAVTDIITATIVADGTLTRNTLNTNLPASVSGTMFQGVTTTITGAGWIDCRGAEKVIFTVAYAAWDDTVAVIGAGVSSFIDSSNMIYDGLPSTNLYPNWNMWVGRLSDSTAPSIISKTSDIVTISDPANSLRWRITGTFNATMTVYYKIIKRRP